MIKILSIDGGGLRGIVPILILQKLELIKQKRMDEIFDLFAGTSTGGLISCGLSLKGENNKPIYNLEDLKKVYLEQGKIIFPQKNWFKKGYNSIKSIFNPEFSDKGINEVLKKLMENHRLTDCLKPLFITSYDVKNNQPLFFKSRHAENNPAENAKLFDICRATSAGPTYLPAHSFNFNNNDVVCVDGGVFINNPSMGALVEVSKYSDYYGVPKDIKFDFSNLMILSLSTGHYNGSISKKEAKDWGKIKWIKPIIDIMMYGVNQATDYEVSEILPENNYLRINISIDEEKFSDMTNSSKECQDFLIQEVESQVFQNSTMMDKFNEFAGRLI